MYKKTLRPAIAMLELIFALVIMGIVLMTAPQLISTATKSGYVAIQQEAINEAASQVNMIMGYHWDEQDANASYLDPILQVSAGDGALNESAPTGRRLGTPEESYRAFVGSIGNRFVASATLGNDAGETQDDEFDDVDDFSGSDTYLTLIEAAAADNVEKSTIKISRTVSYSDDTASYNSQSFTYNPFGSPTGAGSTNIKSITVTLTSAPSASVPIVPDELKKEIILQAFSCNIGGYKLEEKDVSP